MSGGVAAPASPGRRPAPEWLGRLALPAIAAPMFLVSGPDLVVATCRAGVVGSFPALNQRSTEGFDAWCGAVQEGLASPAAPGAPAVAPWGVNLIVHRSNPRVRADLEVVVRRRVPLVITSLGAVSDVVDAVHFYGGLVLHDVINMRHAASAMRAGVDGLIAVCAGAGGHAGLLSPFAFLGELRAEFDGLLALSGSLSSGRHVAAARLMGADLGYLGTRFIATRESMADGRYKDMLIGARAHDVIYTPAISGVHANFLRPSIVAAGLDPDDLPAAKPMQIGNEERRAWKDVWSAGHGVGAVTDLPTAGELCARMAEEYRGALGG